MARLMHYNEKKSITGFQYSAGRFAFDPGVTKKEEVAKRNRPFG
jgi:hypothetical protein